MSADDRTAETEEPVQQYRTCPEPVWDGPYRMTCGHNLVNDRCVVHGPKPPAPDA